MLVSVWIKNGGDRTKRSHHISFNLGRVHWMSRLERRLERPGSVPKRRSSDLHPRNENGYRAGSGLEEELLRAERGAESAWVSIAAPHLWPKDPSSCVGRED